MKRLFCFLILILVADLVAASHHQPPLKLGVLAYRPKPQVMAQWQPVAEYLQSTLEQPVELKVYNHTELGVAVAQRSVDLVITTANQFILLLHTSGLSAPIATLIMREGSHHLSAYGSTIITRADREDINTLEDLAAKRIAVVSLEAFAGYQMPAFELVEAGIPIPTDEKLLITGQPHDRVVEAVLAGRADAGFIRTGLLESLAEKGELSFNQFKVLNPQKLPRFPYAVSTRLYPEWPVATMPQIDAETASRLAATLYLMPQDILEGTASKLYGFGVPANYDGVEKLLRRLRLPPFDSPPEIRLSDLWRQYASWVITLSGLLLLLVLASTGLVVMVRRSQRSLQQLERLAEKEKMILANLVEGVYGVDTQGHCIFINPRALSILGLTEEEVIGMDAHALFHGRQEDGAPYPAENCPVNLVLRDGEKRELEDLFIHRDGRKVPVWLGISAMRHDTGIMGAVVVFQDITERKRAGEALRQSELKYRQIVDTANEGIWVLDVDTTTTFVNRQMAEMLGYPVEEMIGRPMEDFMFEEDVPDHLKRMEARRGGVSESYERRFRRKDEQTLWTSSSATPIFDEEHRFNGSFAMLTDITERKRNDAVNTARLHLVQFSLTHPLEDLLEETLNETEELTGSQIGFYHFVDDDQAALTLQRWSSRTKAVFCKAEGQGLHYPIEEAGVWVDCVRQRKAVVHNDYASLPHRKGLPEGHAEVVRELVVPVFRGEKITAILGVGNKPADYDEKDVKVVSLIADLAWEIAERKRVEEELDSHHHRLEEQVAKRTQELAKTRDAAEAANRAKSIFLSNMSHELRTPLNAILGFTEIMVRNERLPEDEHSYLEIINRSGHHLLSLINDVLEISRIEAGRLALQLSPLDLIDMLGALQDFVELGAREKGLALHMKLPPSIPRYIVTDASKLRQVILNLLSNAVKYTDQGEVELSVSAKTLDGQTQLNFRVRDTGIGIATEDLEHVFQPFFQAEDSAALNVGTGLGLTISREYAQLMGGSLSVESKLHKGSTFHLTLPVELAEAPVQEKSEHGPVIGLQPQQPEYRVLLVEDDEDNRRLLEEILKRVDFQVRAASNGEQAVAIFRVWHPHFIWMDMRMPVMDGYEAIRRIRALPGGHEVKIVALTASAFREDRGKIIAAGCDDVLPKPLNQEQLFSTMKHLLGVRYRYAELPQEAPIKKPGKVDTSSLPAPLLEALCQAAVTLDQDAAQQIVNQIRDIDSALSDKLEQLVRGYRYDQILTYCDRTST
ncbi:MAG: PhnD/SsuA/transferrin family substrate-binding protein [Candidatus Thiodiazotropha sp.]